MVTDTQIENIRLALAQWGEGKLLPAFEELVEAQAVLAKLDRTPAGYDCTSHETIIGSDGSARAIVRHWSDVTGELQLRAEGATPGEARAEAAKQVRL